MPFAIKTENLSKAYQLGQIGTGTLQSDFKRWYARARGKEDPFLKIGETNNRSQKGNSDVVWSLRDINFEIQQGEAVGIIGRNGAGKSTLLKILSRVTSPTTGKITGNGRIASLLEVGTGFHPDLTGRENIYLNGTILGMRKNEITRKFDEIVGFSGVERYIDTPVKRYSSGMYVRLAFAVAAHLESEILIVDEVLAVGDAEFQKKCLGKMNEVSKSEGRTVLFVSHNMAAIKNLCNRGILLENGQLKYAGSIENSISSYLNNHKINSDKNLEAIENRSGTGDILFSKFYLENEKGEKTQNVFAGDSVVFVFHLKVNNKYLKKIDIGFSLHSIYDDTYTYLYSSLQNKFYQESINDYLTVKCLIKEFPFNQGRLIVKGRITAGNTEIDWPKENLGIIDVEFGDFYKTGKIIGSGSPFLIQGVWE